MGYNLRQGEVVYFRMLHPLHMVYKFFPVQVVSVVNDVVLVQTEMDQASLTVPCDCLFKDTSMFRILYA